MRLDSNVPQRIHQALLELAGIQDQTALEIIHVFGHINHLIGHLAEMHAKDDGLSMPRLRVLMWLLVAERQGRQVSPSDLSKYRNVRRNTTSTLLSKLEDQGLVERTVDSEDRRRFHIQLTDAGRAAAEEYTPRLAEHIQSIFVDLTPDERETLLHLLEKVRTTLLQTVSGSAPDAIHTCEDAAHSEASPPKF